MKHIAFKSYEIYLKSQIDRHKNRKYLTVDRKPWRNRDIGLIKVLNPSIKSVLCMGCRDESEVKSFIEAGFESLGIDIVPSKSDLIKYCDMHFMADTLGDKTWDLVFSSHSLEHSNDPLVVLEHIRRVSRIGAYFILPIIDSPIGTDCALFEFMASANSFTTKNIKSEWDSHNISYFDIIDSHVETSPVLEGHIYVQISKDTVEISRK